MSLNYTRQTENSLKITLESASKSYKELQPETAQRLIKKIIDIISSSNNYNDLDQAADALIGGNKPSEYFLKDAFEKVDFATGRDKSRNGWGGGTSR